MEPSDGSPPKGSSDADSRHSAEHDPQQDTETSDPVNSLQTSDSDLQNSQEVTERTGNGVTNSASPEGEGKDDITSAEHESVLLGCEIKTEESSNTEETAKTSKEDVDMNFFKYVEEFAHTIKKFSVITTYSSKHRPRQPYMNPPDGSSNAPAEQGSAHPALIPRPPEPTRSPEPPRRPEPPRSPEPSRRPEPPSDVSERPQPNQPPFPQARQPETAPRPMQQLAPHPLGQPTFAPYSLPGSFVWAPLPTKIPSNVPHPLAQLLFVENLFVIQLTYYDYFTSLDEFFLVQNKNGECLYLVYETIDLGEMALCDNCQAYRLHVIDMYHNEAIRLHRLSGCNSCVCYYPEMEVYAPPNSPVGVITRKFNCFSEEYTLRDPDRNEMFKMVGPCCATNCCGTFEADFVIQALDEDETEVGFIRREVGYLRSYFENDLFGLTMPVDMDVRMKAVFLGFYLLCQN